MKDLKVTKTVVVITLLIVFYRFFYQPNLKQVNWQRGEKKLLFAEIENSKTKKPDELSLIVKTKSGMLNLNIAQIHYLAKCNKGNKIKATIKVYPLMPAFHNSRALYDYLLFRQGHVARAWASDFKCIGNEQQVPLRLKLSALLQEKYGESEILSILAAMNFGAGEILSESVKELFKDLGLSHTLVVSGFHIGLVNAFIFYILDYLFSRSSFLLNIIPSEFLASPLALLGATLFCFFSGFAAPCLRALVFLFASVLFRVIGSSAGSIHRLLITLIVIFVFDSVALFDLSLLLSVAAVIGVVCGLQIASLASGFLKKVLAVVAISFFAWTFTLPLVLVFFGQIAPYSTFLNVALLPLITFFFSIIGFPAMLLGLIYFKQLFSLYLKFLDLVYSLLWEIHENFPLRAEILDFRTALNLAIILTIFNALIFIFLYRLNDKKNDEFLQLARA